MTIIIPYGVFMRYVMNSPSSWPEPGGHPADGGVLVHRRAAAYRARAHIAVTTLLNARRRRTAAHRVVGRDRHGDRRALHDQVGRSCW
jgi:TRAP-type C4-dicarboxylate transport system permease small subunit